METRTTRIGLATWSALVILFLWIPLVIIAIYAFNSSNVQSWPIPGWTFHWFRVAWHNADARDALLLSVKVGAATTGIAIVLGTMAATAIVRFKFFGRESVSFLLVLPIALPGIITGMALNSFYVFAGLGFSMWTIVYQNFSTNLPFAAAFAVVPMAIMGAYLVIARRLGAFEAL